MDVLDNIATSIGRAYKNRALFNTDALPEMNGANDSVIRRWQALSSLKSDLEKNFGDVIEECGEWLGDVEFSRFSRVDIENVKEEYRKDFLGVQSYILLNIEIIKLFEGDTPEMTDKRIRVSNARYDGTYDFLDYDPDYEIAYEQTREFREWLSWQSKPEYRVWRIIYDRENMLLDGYAVYFFVAVIHEMEMVSSVAKVRGITLEHGSDEPADKPVDGSDEPADKPVDGSDDVPLELQTIFTPGKEHIWMWIKRHMRNYQGSQRAAEFAQVMAALTYSNEEKGFETWIAIDRPMNEFIGSVSRYIDVGGYNPFSHAYKRRMDAGATYILFFMKMRKEILAPTSSFQEKGQG